jgi:hypothetical protein
MRRFFISAGTDENDPVIRERTHPFPQSGPSVSNPLLSYIFPV